MKKQYTFVMKSAGKFYVYFYHDGELVKTDEVKTRDFAKYIEKIESEERYARGYTQEDFKAVEEEYHEAVQKYMEADASRIGW